MLLMRTTLALGSQLAPGEIKERFADSKRSFTLCAGKVCEMWDMKDQDQETTQYLSISEEGVAKHLDPRRQALQLCLKRREKIRVQATYSNNKGTYFPLTIDHTLREQ